MALQKTWLAVPAQALTANGTSDGVITVTSTLGYYVKQKVVLYSNALPIHTAFQVKRVVSKTQLWVGPQGTDLKSVSDVSGYLTSDNAQIFAPEQPRFTIPELEIHRAVYEEDPAVAYRIVLVDPFGNKYQTNNPLPVQLSDGSINIETLNQNLSVQLTDKNNYPNPGDVYDSVRVGDGTNLLKINPDGSIDVNASVTPAPSSAVIVNVPMTLANTEYNFTFPTNTKRYLLYVRGNARFQYSFTSGASNTNFKTIEMGNSYLEDGILATAPLTIYFQASQPGKVLEVLYWT